ncbi:PQQ-binding-like beta-propeller repeat protein [Candidatus Latescibacterota bacterium]
MKNANRLIAAIAVFLTLISVSFVFAQDWTQWRGTNRDGKVAGFEAPVQWPSEMTQKWNVSVGSGDATPALVDNKLYVFTRQSADEVILCLDATSGKELWQNRYATQSVSGPASSHPGPRSSPTVSDGMIITFGACGMLSCLEKDTGKVVWRHDAFSKGVPQYFTGMSPIVVDNICVAHLGGNDTGELIAFDLTTGKEKWKWTGDGPAYGSPIMLTVEGTKQIVVQAEKNIVSIAVDDGRQLWQVPTSAQRRFYNSATPIVDGHTVIFTGQGQGTRAVTVQKQGNDFTVKELWRNEELGTAYNTPVLKDGLLFGLSDRGRLYCMNAGTGQTAWADENSHPNFGALLDAGSVILALPSDSELISFTPSGKGYEELARIKVSDTPVYAHPVIAGNRIYVKDEATLTMWTIE